VVAAGVAVVAASAVLGISSMTAGAQAPATSSGIVLTVGAKENQRVVSWYTSANTTQSVQVAPTASLGANGEFPASATTFAATVTANTVNGGFNGHAILDGLQENTDYSYRVGADGGWSATYTFKTRKFDGDWDFLFFGDPQIGSSGDVAKDAAGWADTLDVSLAANPNAELLVSGGDQVETANTEAQWSAYLQSAKLRSVPTSPTIGNHDVGGKAYDQHFWTPNTDRSSPFYNGDPATRSGGDYWYMYKGTLFIHLNSNAYNNGSDAAHVAYVTDVVNAHPEAQHRVLVYHHSIYSPASHANDGDNQARRRDFPTAFSNLGIDLVLQGHDHSYSRSYSLKNGQKANADEQPGAAEVSAGPGGVIYVTGNSASGSKYYDLTTPRAGSDFPADPLDPTGKRHYANSSENQEHVRTYVKVKVTKDALYVENVRSGTCAAPNAAVERGNVDWCGPNSGASPAEPVGSVVDKVTIRRMATQTDASVGGTVAPTLGLTLGAPASFGGFTPGLAKDYTASTTATVVSTAGDATLTAADPSSTAPGRLVNTSNPTFALASPLQVAGTPLPSTVKTYAAPVSNDTVTVDFKQSIAADEPLRTGSYAKTLTFTLSTTNP
jgi:hypothetical protein